MTDGDALLRAILAHPADDTARLAYADWLDEQAHPVPWASCPRCRGAGEVTYDMPAVSETRVCGACGGSGTVPGVHPLAARAEFIRLQVELARLSADGHGSRPTRPEGCPTIGSARKKPRPGGQRMPTCRVCDDALGMEERERELAARLCPVWWPHSEIRGVFRRGFVEHVTCDADSWVLHADALLAAHPVTRVTLKTVPAVDSDGVHVRVRGRARWYLLDALPSTRSHPDNFYTALLKMEWPGVTFDLPDRVRLQPDGPGSYRFG